MSGPLRDHMAAIRDGDDVPSLGDWSIWNPPPVRHLPTWQQELCKFVAASVLVAAIVAAIVAAFALIYRSL